MARWICCGSLVLLIGLCGLAGCGKTPPPTAELTEEEEKQLEADLRRRVEREGEGSTRRASEGKTASADEAGDAAGNKR